MVRANYKLEVGPRLFSIASKGVITGKLTKALLNISICLISNGGRLLLDVIDCQASLGHLNIEFDSNSLLGEILNFVSKHLAMAAEISFKKEICDLVKFYDHVLSLY